MSHRADLRALAHRLQAWLQEELGAEQRLRDLLLAEERAIRAADAGALADAARRIEEEVRGGAARERRRAELVKAFGRALQVDPGVLSISSIAERLGQGTPEAEGVLRLRAELRRAAADVARLGRRIASLARYHQGLFAELMGALLGVEAGRTIEGGALIDARG